MSKPFTHRFRVRYSEVDPQAVVFNSRYLEYADVVVSEFFRERDIGFAGPEPVEFHVARAEVNYRQPLRADELVEGRLRVTRFGTTSLSMAIDLYGAEDGADAAPRAEIALVNVHVDLATGKPLPLPDWLCDRMSTEAEMEHG